MKNTFAAVALLSMSSCMFSCTDRTANDGKTTMIQDSLATVLPTWQALKIKVSDDRSKMTIVVGDMKLYAAGTDVKKQKAEEVGKLVERIYGKDNVLETGSIIVTKDIQNKSEAPADGITTPIDFAGLKAVVFPK